jgi:2-methylcitrate dehydratase PrpD
LRALLDRVSTAVAPEFEAEFPARAPAEVVVETTDGRILHSGRIEALWEPPDTLPTDGELEAKFRWLVGPVLGGKQCDQLISTIWTLEDRPDARILIRLGRKPRPRG